MKRRIEARGLAKWQEGMRNKSTLKWYRNKEKPEKIQFHVGDWSSRLLVKVRTGTLEVKARNREEENQDCSSCSRGVRETVEHFLVECDRYDEERAWLIRKVMEEIGQLEWDRRLLEVENGGELTVLGLYQEERQSVREKIIRVTKDFLVKAWNRRIS